MKATSLTAALLLLAIPRAASAGGPCNALTKLEAGGAPGTAPAPAVVYVTGSSAAKPLLASLAPLIFADPVNPRTVVFRSQDSCSGVASIVAGRPMATTDTTTATYWDAKSVTAPSSTKTAREESCTLANGQIADVGVSDVFAQTCGFAAQGLPATIADFHGPVQTMTFAVNKASKEQSLSAEAAYLSFGFGNLAPWTDDTLRLRRNVSSGTQLMIATAIGLDPARWNGVDKRNSDGVYDALESILAQEDADKSIGILGAEHSSRPGVRQLAYQHVGQRCGYKPDIRPLDKKNVREGRYALWGPMHLFAQIDGTSFAKSRGARDLIAYLLGTAPPPLGVDLIRTEVALHVVPPCAMNVQRSTEMGPMSAFQPPVACGCAYDQEALGTTTCSACTTSAQCKAKESCNYGFCEAP